MILTFAKLQKLSGLQKPTAVKAWLKREGVSYIRDAAGKPFTTLDALNRKLHRAGDDGFTLNDPQGGLSEKRAVVSRRPQQVDRADQSRRGADGPAPRFARGSDDPESRDRLRAVGAVFAKRRDFASDKAGI